VIEADDSSCCTMFSLRFLFLKKSERPEGLPLSHQDISCFG